MKQTAIDTEYVKELIIKKAMDVFAQKGYHATNMQDIAEVVGISRGPLYYHYKNKLELFNKVVDSVFTTMYTDISNIFKQDINIFEKIRQDLLYCADYVNFIEHARYTVSSDDQEFNLARTRFDININELFELKNKHIRLAIEKKELREDILSTELVGMIFVFFGGLRSLNKKVQTIDQQVHKVELERAVDIMVSCLKNEYS